ncbi:hypothetical protein DN38_3277 [Vibrio cholerae]|nr:hypothetical protein DN38_3277 [Vibrio cholerae]
MKWIWVYSLCTSQLAIIMESDGKCYSSFFCLTQLILFTLKAILSIFCRFTL